MERGFDEQFEKKKKDEIGKGKAFVNTMYSLKLMWQISPVRVVHSAIRCLIGYFEWLFYSAFFLVYVVSSLEKGEGFEKMLFFLAITASVFICINIYYAYFEEKFIPETEPKINNSLYNKPTLIV